MSSHSPSPSSSSSWEDDDDDILGNYITSRRCYDEELQFQWGILIPPRLDHLEVTQDAI